MTPRTGHFWLNNKELNAIIFYLFFYLSLLKFTQIKGENSQFTFSSNKESYPLVIQRQPWL